MIDVWLAIRGYFAGVMALVSCPCHLPLTIPLVLTLTAGTAVGSWLSGNLTYIYAVSFPLFIGSLALAGKWLLTEKAKTCQMKSKKTQSAKTVRRELP